MLKKLFNILFVIIIFFMGSSNVLALTGVVNVNDSLTLRDAPSTSGKKITSFYNNTEVTILDINAGSSSGCNNWYKVQYGDYVGYSCGEYIIVNNEEQKSDTEDDSYVKSNYDKAPGKDGTIMCYEDAGSLGIRSSAGGNKTGALVNCGEEINIKETVEKKGTTCPYWYKIERGSDTGYICGYFVNTTKLSSTALNYYNNEVNGDTIENYKVKLTEAGFPESYHSYLLEIHARYPGWKFVAEKMPMKFGDAIAGEAGNGANLLQGSVFDKGYLSTASHTYNLWSDTFYEYDGEPGYYNASREAIAYYMDPRNYLNEKYIFAFETLGFSINQDAGVVSSILKSQSFWPEIYKYYDKEDAIKDSQGNVFDDVVHASSNVGISAVHVASRIKQEISGLDITDSRIGGSFTYSGVNYSNHYNFFNIKSRCTNCSSIYSGYAFEKSWNTPYKGIYGGASFMYDGYISLNQDTIYYEKFDVSTNNGHYTHQYMQNITAPLTEGVETYTSYNSISGLLDEALVFIIPVYDDMPEERVEAPSNLSPNSYLKSIKVDNEEIEGFSYDKFDYSMEVSSDVSSVDVSVSTVNSGASVLGNGTITLEEGENKIELVVTAENGNVSTYNVVINRQIKEEDIVLSNTNSLESITIEEIEFEFDKDTLEYNLEVPFETNKINISYELEDDTANIEADNEVELIVGLNKINIAVTAENGDVRTYTLNITRKEVAMSEVLNATGVKYNNENKYIYGIDVDTSTDSLIENIKSVSTSISVVIKDSEGKVKSGVFATGDKVIISDGETTTTYEVLIYGDVTGDGVIDKLDYLAVLRHYYKYKEYNGVYKEAADADKNGVIDKLDFLAVLKDYYGYKAIEQ